MKPLDTRCLSMESTISHFCYTAPQEQEIPEWRVEAEEDGPWARLEPGRLLACDLHGRFRGLIHSDKPFD